MQKKAPVESTETRAPRRPRRRVGLLSVFSLAVAFLVFVVLALALSGRTLTAPEALRANIEARINADMDGAQVELGALEFGVDRRGIPHVLMNGLRLADPLGGAVAELNWLAAELSVERLIRREFAAEKIFLTGAQITVRRTAAGRFTVVSGGLGGSEQSIPDILAQLDHEMTEGAFASLSEVVAGGVVITLEDARSRRIWQATNASATLRSTGDALSLSVTSDVFNGTDDLAAIQLSLSRIRETGHVQMGVRVENMPAAEIAVQSPVLSWLTVLDAPISGAMRTELDETGNLTDFAGTLDVKGGALRPVETIDPVAFEAAKAYFTFDPARQRIDFSQISFSAEEAEILATGHTYLTEFDGLWPGAYVSQLEIEQVTYRGGDMFDGPVELADIAADLRVRLDPFTVDLGQIAFENEGAPVSATGRVAADADGWTVSLDATTPRISGARVLEFWPRRAGPQTRGWLTRNIEAGMLSQTALGLRFHTGEEPDINLSFEFDEGQARFLPEMPPLETVGGRGLLSDYRFSLHLDKGMITGPGGEAIDIAGSRFAVIDTRPKPSMGQIDVAAVGPLVGVLGVLNNAPLRLMERAGRPVEIARATLEGAARIRLPLKDGIRTEEIDYDVSADLSGVASDVLVPGRVFSSDRLRLRATPEAVGLEGAAQLDGVPLTARWRQPLGDGAEAGGQITGQVSLSQETVEVFDLPLPDGSLQGAGRADYILTLPADPEVPPALQITSDLRGLGIGMAALGWQKPAPERGALTIDARLGRVPEIEAISLETQGFSLEGRLDLAESGGLRRADFETLRLGEWLDAQVELTPAPGGGAPGIAVTGGTLDLRALELGATSVGGEGSGGPITLALDRLRISEGISLAPVRGDFRMTAGGIVGTFEGRVNGGAQVRGTLSPANAGTAVRIVSDDAAGVLRDAGLTPNTREGTLDLVLTPVAGAASGVFDGEFLIENVRLRDAPAMADLLDAISIVGLLDQLSGPGIRFDSVDGQFRLSPRQIRITRAAATGPSIGISADGLYDLRSNRLDIRGVVSPVYFLNGIGSLFTRRGEGLFGFNYRMTGAAAAPRVGVNPLSILTPGAFRNIFRRAPPGG